MAKHQEDKVSIDLKPVITFFTKQPKTRKALLISLLILTAMAFSIHFRSYPATLPVTEQWAEDSITNSVRNQVAANVNQEYPNLPADRKNAIIEERLAEVIDGQEAAIQQEAKAQADLIRQEYQNDDGQTYLLAIDPYYYWRHTKNVLDHGYGADIEVDGVRINDHQLAPLGRVEQETDYHSQLSAFTYKVVRLFDKDAKLFNVFFWMPVLISALAVIPAFFIARKKAGNLGGLIAAMIVAVSTVFLGRTPAGFADTDAYNVLFPLLILWAFLEAFETKDNKKKLILSGATGLLIGIYAKIWQGWWYLFDFMIIVMAVYIIFIITKQLLKGKKLRKALAYEETKKAGISFGAILVSSGVFVTLLHSFQNFINAPLNPIRYSGIQDAAKADLWPNVFTTVAELNRASLDTIVNQIGGSIYFYLACLGVIITLLPVKQFKTKDWAVLSGGAVIYLLLLTKPFLQGNPYVYLALLLVPVAIGLLLHLKDDRNIDIKYAIFLVIWFAGTIYASTQGVRFILLLVPAYAVAFGILIGQLYKTVTAWSEQQFDTPQAWLKLVLIILALALLIKPIGAAHQTALHEVPSMDDTWWASLEKIDQEAAPDAIINSWWDFGHWFKAIADRAVTFDGTTQNSPMAHWVGKALSTSDEQEAIGILRMLDCGSRTGFDQLAKELQGTDDLKAITPETTLEAKAIMDGLINIWDEEDAKDYLLDKAGLDDDAAERVLALTHCDPPENYFITSEDMVGKASVWGHFGNWDFRKAYVYNELRKQRVSEATPIISRLFNTTEQEAGQLYYDALTLTDQQQANAWISPWPSYLLTEAARCAEDNGTVTCSINRNVGSQQGQTIRIEQAIIPLGTPEEAVFKTGFYNQQTGQRIGEAMVKPQAVIIGDDDGLERTPIEDPGFTFDLLVAEQEDTYRAVVASEELADSLFTKLFYLEGAYTDRFEKFSDLTSPVTGQRVIIWKVLWEAP
ncbi:hypothetical protein JXA12_01830 [Candidatus Woesearchaeota archaeon]|nr:hypothetical protein [Candidatus Woesearchaeota archaeon]